MKLYLYACEHFRGVMVVEPRKL